MAIDYFKLIEKELGITFEIVVNLSWPEIVQGAKERTLDVIATANITEERKEFLEFTAPYIPTPLVIMTHKDDTTIEIDSNITGRKVANCLLLAPEAE